MSAPTMHPVSGERMTPEREAEIRAVAAAEPGSTYAALLRELDATRAERDGLIADSLQRAANAAEIVHEAMSAREARMTRELDATRAELGATRKEAEERGQMLFDEQMTRQRTERERDEARKEIGALARKLRAFGYEVHLPSEAP